MSDRVSDRIAVEISVWPGSPITMDVLEAIQTLCSSLDGEIVHDWQGEPLRIEGWLPLGETEAT